MVDAVSGDVKFSVDSQLLGELGERLVTRNYIALAELVKNSYDADATKVIISLDSKKSEIVISDNGHGMSTKQVIDFWMRIATDNKKREPFSEKYGRKKTGSKGIGRFACRRLGHKLVIETVSYSKKSQKYERTSVNFNWAEFKSGTDLTNIENTYTVDSPNNSKTGTTLKIASLTETWSQAQFDLLRREVLSLAAPIPVRKKGYSDDPGFDVEFKAPGYVLGTGLLVDQFMNAGWGKLTGRIDQNGKLSVELEAKKIGTKKYTFPDKYASAAGARIELAWMPQVRDAIRDSKTLTQEKLTKLRNEASGIRIYYDGFRMYPYGDESDDWLDIVATASKRLSGMSGVLDSVIAELGVKEARPLLLLAPKSILGKVHVSSIEAPGFEPKLDRQGFVRNDSFDELRTATRLAVEWMVLYYAKFTLMVDNEKSLEAGKKATEMLRAVGGNKESKAPSGEIKTVQNALSLLQFETERTANKLSASDRKIHNEHVNAAKDAIAGAINAQDRYIAILRSIASTSSLFFAFSHEVKNLTSRLESNASAAEALAKIVPKNNRKELLEFANSLRTTQARFDQQIRLFTLLARSSRDTKRKSLLVRKIAEEVIAGFEGILEDLDIAPPKLTISEDLRTKPMIESELYSVIVNLVSNAIKAVLASGGKSILIEAKEISDEVRLRVYDDGVGLNKKYWDVVFLPLEADPEGKIYPKLEKKLANTDLFNLGRGSGLGLDIVRGIAEKYGKRARFVEPPGSWRTCIEVTLP